MFSQDESAGSKETKETAVSRIYGITREEEEAHLANVLDLTQRNLEKARALVYQLAEDVEELRAEVDQTGDKDSLLLWNNAKSQLKENRDWLIRYEKARVKPFFGRIDYLEGERKQEESYYIGRVGIADEKKEPVVIDWRTPVASMYYENELGPGEYTVEAERTYPVDLKRKRTYEIEKDRLKDFYDLDVVANDELLTKYLSKNKTEVLGEIIATIQKEQNRIIRRSPKHNLIVQGVAGSGKTTVAMHRISYILYNYADLFRPEDFYIIGSNRILLNYITGVLPELDVYGVRQMTMEELFVRLLYEDWDPQRFTWHRAEQADVKNRVKGSLSWFRALEQYCWEYERQQVSCEPVYMEKTGKLLLEGERISQYLSDHPQMSMQSKCLMLNEMLYSRYENEITGRQVSFTPEEKKELEKKYRYYYGKDGWKGSIFELYRDFLGRQRNAGFDIDCPEESFDIYDLAALAYLYKRIKEIDPIREASHVVIDEAQDFGMMAYSCLYYCMRGCTYTIMGDTSQNIHYDYGLNDWEELRKLVLTGSGDHFGLLRKSYRNTVEISDFATEILRHGDFSIYPVEPILRHGTPVTVKAVAGKAELETEAVRIIENWKNRDYGTIAVVCRSEAEAWQVSERLGRYLDIKSVDTETEGFGSGVMVLPVVYTKGLEFDAVLIWDPDNQKYPADNGHVKMLYVTATRALHELVVLHQGNLTPLIGEKPEEGKHLGEFDMTEEEEKKTVLINRKALEEEQRLLRQQELNERDVQGPARIKISPEQLLNKRNAAADQMVLPVSSHGGGGSSYGAGIKAKCLSGISPKGAAVSDSGNRPAMKVRGKGGEEGPMNPSLYAFGSMPEEAATKVKGHPRPDTSVRWVKKTKTSVEVTSRYGILTLTPIAEDCVHITFVKGLQNHLQETCWKPEPVSGLKWAAKESPKALELQTKKLIIHIEKKDGILCFLTPDRKVLLKEKQGDPRLVEGTETWNFFEIDRNDRHQAKGVLLSDLTDISFKARYISFGKKKLRMPMLLSNKGYGIGVASEKTVMYCGIPPQGPYLYTEGTDQIDYYFFYGGTPGQNLERYKTISSIKEK